MESFFNPKSVAIIGASAVPGKLGHEITKNFVKYGFKGEVYPVNLKWDKILGLKVWRSVLDIPNTVDLAVIATPAKSVPKIMEECARKKVKAVIIISGGFRETGHKGAVLEEQIVRVVKKSGIRVIGPNCVGIYDAITKVDTIFDPPSRLQRPSAGPISIIAQSAAVGAGLLEWLDQEEIGVSKFISYGNACDVNEADLLEYLGDDESTKVIILQIEGFSDGRKLIEVAKRVTLKKPVVGLKTGRTRTGGRVARSHTAVLAGRDEICDAAFKQSGIIRAHTCEEALDFAKALAYQPLPKGDKVLIFGNSGGTAVIASDFCEDLGIPLAALKKESINRIKEIFPPHTIIQNPMDLTGDVTSENLGRALEYSVSDAGVDCVVLLVQFQTPLLSEEVVDIIGEVSQRFPDKPFVFGGVGGDYTLKLARMLEKKYRIPAYKCPERAVKALWALIWRSKYLKGREAQI